MVVVKGRDTHAEEYDGEQIELRGRQQQQRSLVCIEEGAHGLRLRVAGRAKVGNQDGLNGTRLSAARGHDARRIVYERDSIIFTR